MEIVEFDYSHELGRDQVGFLKSSDFPAEMREMIAALDDPAASISRADLKLENFVCYVVSYGVIKFFKKVPRTSILRSRHHPKLGLTANKVIGITEQYILESPYNFDVVYDGQNALIFNESAFFTMFGELKTLKSKIDSQKPSIEKVVSDSVALLSYVKKRSKTLMRFYYKITSSGLPRVSQEAIDRVNGGTGKNFNLDSSGKVVCTESNARDVYHLLMGKFGVELLDNAPIIIISASTTL